MEKRWRLKFSEQSGAVVLNADEIGHRVLQEAGIRQAAVEHWGSEILDSSGQIDRRRLAAIVFQSEEDLVFLEKLTHQRIRDQISVALQNLAQNHTATVILDAPLLLEAGWESLCEAIVFIESSLGKSGKASGRPRLDPRKSSPDASPANFPSKRNVPRLVTRSITMDQPPNCEKKFVACGIPFKGRKWETR